MGPSAACSRQRDAVSPCGPELRLIRAARRWASAATSRNQPWGGPFTRIGEAVSVKPDAAGRRNASRFLLHRAALAHLRRR